jgi:adenylate cyclase
MQIEMQSQRDRRNWRLFFRLSIAAAVISAVFGYSQGPDTPLHSLMTGIAGSIFIATPIMLLEIKGQRRVLRRLRRLPLPAYLGLKIAFYLVVILGGLSLLPALHITDAERFAATFRASLVFSVIMAVGTNVVIEIGMLLGFGTLRNLFTGRYVQPRRELRAFLLIDMRDSTGLAERLGAVPFHELLNDFFRDVSEAALECGAEIHKYVGDEAILTWTQNSVADGDCLRCPFIAAELIEGRRAHYLARYGAVPAFRASLHYGEIVAGEIGDVRREIAYVGDTLNSAARLLEAAKEMGRSVLASEDLLGQAALPDGVTAEKLPMLSVRGRARPLGVSALARA